MPIFTNLINKRFGRLIVTEQVDKNKWGRIKWLCLCDCGQEKEILGYHLRSGHTQSCGCLRKEIVLQQSTKHGHRIKRKATATYTSWRAMNQRCNNPNNKNYYRYGERGITICQHWSKFLNFLRDMGKRPSKDYSIDRIDNNGNYCKSNCRWATLKQQARNKKNNRLITHNQKTRCLATWAEEYNIPCRILWARLYKYKWSITKALTTPVRKCQRKEQKNV